MNAPTHDWKCGNCGHWSPDTQEQTRCASCAALRPDIAQYRKRSAKAAKGGYRFGVSLADTEAGMRALSRAAAILRPAEPGDIVWVCEQCRHEHNTTATFCPECGNTRPVNGPLRLKAPERYPRAGFLIGVAGTAILWAVAGGWAALGVFLIVWGDNLGRNK